MTIERKITIGLSDIQAITFECTGCLSRLSVSPDSIGSIPDHCPRCRLAWSLLEPAQYQSKVSPFVNLTMSIERLRLLDKEGTATGFRILLEFSGESR